MIYSILDVDFPDTNYIDWSMNKTKHKPKINVYYSNISLKILKYFHDMQKFNLFHNFHSDKEWKLIAVDDKAQQYSSRQLALSSVEITY